MKEELYRIWKGIMLMACFLSLGGCIDAIHEFPDPDAIPRVSLNVLTLTINAQYDVYTEYDGTKSRATTSDGYDLRIIVEIYRKGTTQCVDRYVWYTSDLGNHTYRVNKEFILPIGNYDVVAWADYITCESYCDLYYNSGQLNTISPCGTYIGNNDWKGAYYATESIELTEDKHEYSLLLEPPFGKYQIIATGAETFMERVRSAKGVTRGSELDGMYVKVCYQNFFPYGFNACTGKPNDAITGVTFTGKVDQITDNEILLASDFIWVNGQSSSVAAVLMIYDKDHTLMAQTSAINIPYQRKKLTIIRGDFLKNAGNSGIGIDPNFEGEYNITFP